MATPVCCKCERALRRLCDADRGPGPEWCEVCAKSALEDHRKATIGKFAEHLEKCFKSKKYRASFAGLKTLSELATGYNPWGTCDHPWSFNTGMGGDWMLELGHKRYRKLPDDHWHSGWAYGGG